MASDPAETTDEQTSAWGGLTRRPLLKALGLSAVIPISSALPAAGGGGNGTQTDTDGTAETIDPVWGYPATDTSQIPETLDPHHEVELHRVLFDPEDPEHPSFFHFEPSGLQVEVGDIVQFTFESPNHTITSYHPDNGFQRRIPEGVPAFSSPVVREDGAWLYRFDEEGLYDLYCAAHSVLGMVMRVVVGDIAEEDLPNYADTFQAEGELFPPVPAEALEAEFNMTSEQNQNCEWPWLTAPRVLGTDALDPMNVQEAGEVPFEAVADELGIAFEPHEDT